MASVFKSESFLKLSPADQSRNINLINLGRFLENYFEFGLKNEKVLNVCVVNGGASFRWSFGPHSAWGSIESTTILTTHPSLVVF